MHLVDSHLNRWFKAPNVVRHLRVALLDLYLVLPILSIGQMNKPRSEQQEGKVATLSKAAMRKQIVAKRLALSQPELDVSATALADRLRDAVHWLKLKNVGTYVPIRGEISPHQLLASLQPQKVCIPYITDMAAGEMHFCSADLNVLTNPRLMQSSDVPRNSYGIPEPITSTVPVPVRQLDALFVPLVAFDRFGCRLGLGAGFYDRAFAFRLNRRAAARPLLIGLAHNFQEFKKVESQYWDVPMDAIITPAKIIWPQGSH